MVNAKKLIQAPYREHFYQVFEREGYLMYQSWMSPEFPGKMMTYLLGMKNHHAKEEEELKAKAAKKAIERPKL